MRRWLWSVVVACSVLGVTVGVARSAPSSPASSTTTSTYRTHYTRFYTHGPSAQYDSDSGVIGEVPPIRIHLPAGTYTGVVAVSFGYLTHGGRVFDGSVFLRTRTVPYRYFETVFPSTRHLLAAPQRTSTTLVFEIRDVPGDRDLSLAPSVNASSGPRPLGIGTTNVVVDAQFRLAG